MVMRVYLRRLVSAAVPLMVIGMAAGIAAPQDASAASQGAASLTAGGGFSCVLKGGHAYCWGFNGNGELGDGATADSDVPIAVDTSGVLAGKTLTQIAAAANSTCALDSSGAAYCWGYNGSGQLGNGNFTAADSPVAVYTGGVLAGKTLTQISGSGNSMCALDSTGAAYCWGDNSNGQLGNGNEGPIAGSDVPVPVVTSGALAGKTLTQISAGGGNVCALDSTGVAYCWGGDASECSATHPVTRMSRWLPLPSARWPGQRSLRSRWAVRTCVRWITPVLPTVRATTATASSVTGTPPSPQRWSPWTPAAS